MTILAVMVVFLWAAVMTSPTWVLAVGLALGWILVCLGAVDLVAFRLPNALTLPLLVAGLAVSVALPGRPILGHLAGAALGYGVLAAMAFGYRRWRGMDGIGLGDAKLLGASGAWLGWQNLPSVLIIACMAAFGWVALRYLFRGRETLSAPIAFGAPLCLATWVVWLHGPLTL